MAIDRAQVAVFIGPLVPDGDTVILQVLDVGVSGEEPQEFMDDGLEVHLLGGEEGKTIGQVEPHLVAEHALRSGSGTVFLHGAVGSDMS